MFVAANDEIDAVTVEQRQPFLANAEIRTIEFIRARDGDLVHAHDQPVDAAIGARDGELAFEPGALCARRVSAHVRISAILIGDVVVGDADHTYGADGKAVPQAARDVGLSIRRRQREIGLIRAITDRSVAEFILVIAG